MQKWNPNYSTMPVIGTAVNTSSLTMTKTTDYAGNIIYENGQLKRILTENGYIENNTYYFYSKDHLGNVRWVGSENGEVVQYTDYYPFGLPFAGNTGQNAQPYKFGGKEYDSMHGLNMYDFHARGFDGMQFTTMDPLAEKYYSISPYAYCAGNPVKYVDPLGMDVYRYDDKTGNFILYQQTNDNFDQVGKFKCDKKSGEYTLQTNKKGEAKNHIDNVEKGILSDGINFMKNDNVISIGGEGQATVDGVEAFAVNLSDMVGKEIGGAYFSKDGAGATTHISIGNYQNNTLTKSGSSGHTLWQRMNPDSKLGNSITGFFHTHPTIGYNVSDITQPSEQDKRSRNSALEQMSHLQFFILTYPVNYGDKFPYKIPYTTWW